MSRTSKLSRSEADDPRTRFFGLIIPGFEAAGTRSLGGASRLIEAFEGTAFASVGCSGRPLVGNGESDMMIKPLAVGLLSIAVLATPAMAQSSRELGVTRYHHSRAPHARAPYVRGGYGAGYMPAASYYGGPRYPGPRVGAFATAPWTDSYAGYGPYGGYGPGYAPAPGYYYGGQNYPPGPPVGAFATAPWVDE